MFLLESAVLPPDRLRRLQSLYFRVVRSAAKLSQIHHIHFSEIRSASGPNEIDRVMTSIPTMVRRSPTTPRNFWRRSPRTRAQRINCCLDGVSLGSRTLGRTLGTIGSVRLGIGSSWEFSPFTIPVHLHSFLHSAELLLTWQYAIAKLKLSSVQELNRAMYNLRAQLFTY